MIAEVSFFSLIMSNFLKMLKDSHEENRQTAFGIRRKPSKSNQ